MVLNILYQFNEKYVPFAGVSMVSLLENNKEIENITFFLLGEDVSEKSKNRLIKQINIYGRKSVFIEASSVIEHMKELGLNTYRGSYAANIKMFVPDFISQDIDRLLYIDCDTIIEGSLVELINFDMKGNPTAMVLDSMCKNHKCDIGFKREDLHFNTGIILYDMETWRRNNCTERICSHIKNIRSHYMAPDQDIINIVLKGQITRLDIRYNLQPLHMVYKYSQYMRYFGQPQYYTSEEINSAMASPGIFHFFRYLGQFPWHKDSLHPNKEQFDFYMDKSLWKDYKREPTEQNDFVFQMERMLYRVLPKSIFILIFKIGYEIFMWKSNKDSIRQKNNIRM